MTIEEVVARKADIHRQAITFYKSKGMFDGEPRKKRWRLCVQVVAETWMMLGPQADNVPEKPILL